jgi:hypothetical protein
MEKKEKCNSCAQGLSNVQKSLVVVSIYILIAAVVGSIHIFRDLYDLIF